MRPITTCPKKSSGIPSLGLNSRQQSMVDLLSHLVFESNPSGIDPKGWDDGTKVKKGCANGWMLRSSMSGLTSQPHNSCDPASCSTASIMRSCPTMILHLSHGKNICNPNNICNPHFRITICSSSGSAEFLLDRLIGKHIAVRKNEPKR